MLHVHGRQARLAQTRRDDPVQRTKFLSDDRGGRDAALLELDAVVDTPRRAGPSVGDPVDHHVALAHRRLEHLVGHRERGGLLVVTDDPGYAVRAPEQLLQDRKSTRLNSSHRTISYAVF